MFCSQCGKKVSENMLFCPFCGSPIVIPDQDEMMEDESVCVDVKAETDLLNAEHDEPTVSFEADNEDEIRVVPEFVPLDISNSIFEDDSEKMEAVLSIPDEDEVIGLQFHENPVRLQGHMPNLQRAHMKNVRKRQNTRLPQRRFDSNDIFFDGDSAVDSDYDNYDDDGPENSFFVKHIRGIVAFSLFVVVAAIIWGWMVSAAGQMSLGKAGLAWNPSIYADLAYGAYQNGSYSLAGNYYVQAAERAPDNYDYANSAGVAFYMAQDTIRAEAMARRAIGIDPVRSDAYQLLIRLYPDEALRPLEIQSILQAADYN